MEFDFEFLKGIRVKTNAINCGSLENRKIYRGTGPHTSWRILPKKYFLPLNSL